MCIPRSRRPSYHGIIPDTEQEDLGLTVLHPTSQLKARSFLSVSLIYLPSQGILTILRSKDTSRQDFIFFCDRLATILVENALQYLPYSPVTVITPIGSEAAGHRSDAKVCSVCLRSILF